MININRIRKIQMITSIVVFISVFLFCWYVTGFNLKDIQLSKWGVDTKIGIFWNMCLVLLSISIYFNTYHYIKHHKRIQYKGMLQTMFMMVSVSLFITGAVDMHQWLHTITAVIYFFAYPLTIFLLAHFNRRHFQYKEWRYNLIVSVLMVVIPLLFFYVFPGMAIAETVHSGIVIGWNLRILIED